MTSMPGAAGSLFCPCELRPGTLGVYRVTLGHFIFDSKKKIFEPNCHFRVFFRNYFFSTAVVDTYIKGYHFYHTVYE